MYWTVDGCFQTRLVFGFPDFGFVPKVGMDVVGKNVHKRGVQMEVDGIVVIPSKFPQD